MVNMPVEYAGQISPRLESKVKWPGKMCDIQFIAQLLRINYLRLPKNVTFEFYSSSEDEYINDST